MHQNLLLDYLIIKISVTHLSLNSEWSASRCLLSCSPSTLPQRGPPANHKVTAHTLSSDSEGLACSLIIWIWYACADVLIPSMCTHHWQKRGLAAQSHICMQVCGLYAGKHTHANTSTLHEHTHTRSHFSTPTPPGSLWRHLSHLLELPPHTAGCWAATWLGAAQHGSYVDEDNIPTHAPSDTPSSPLTSERRELHERFTSRLRWSPSEAEWRPVGWRRNTGGRGIPERIPERLKCDSVFREEIKYSTAQQWSDSQRLSPSLQHTLDPADGISLHGVGCLVEGDTGQLQVPTWPRRKFEAQTLTESHVEGMWLGFFLDDGSREL